MNLTPTRIALLRLLAHRGEFSVGALADHLAPRTGCTGRVYPWSAQGAARWGGAYVRPLERAGLILVDRHVTCGVGLARLTAKGLAALREHDAGAAQAQSAADLAAAIDSGD